MEQALPDTISLNLADIEQTISFRTRAEPILNLEIFDTLAKAVAQRQQLELNYRKPGQPAEKRVVDAYHLANINGVNYICSLTTMCAKTCARLFPHASSR